MFHTPNCHSGCCSTAATTMMRQHHKRQLQDTTLRKASEFWYNFNSCSTNRITPDNRHLATLLGLIELHSTPKTLEPVRYPSQNKHAQDIQLLLRAVVPHCSQSIAAVPWRSACPLHTLLSYCCRAIIQKVAAWETWVVKAGCCQSDSYHTDTPRGVQ